MKRKLIALAIFAVAMLLFFTKGYVNLDFERPIISLLASFLLILAAIVAIIIGSTESHAH